MSAYFFSWLVYSGVAGGPRYFIFLTNWCYITWNVYLLVAALSATIKVISVYCCAKYTDTTTASLLETPKPYIDIDEPVGCCGREGDNTSWYQKVQWACYYVGVHMAAVVAVLYWGLLYRGGPVDGINANTHLVNSLIALVDILISGVPVRLLHFIYPVIFSIAYATFTGIYFAAGGTNPNGDPYIYGVIDYGSTPGPAAGYIIVIVVVVIPLIHLLLFGVYSVRFWITYHIWKRNEPTPPHTEDVTEIA